MIAIAKIETKPTAADTLNGSSGYDQCQYSAHTSERDLRHQDQRIHDRQRGPVQDSHNYEQGQRYNDHQPVICGL